MANDIGGVWRTIGGRRVFIKEGQDLVSAMRESGKFKSAKKIKIGDDRDKKLDDVIEKNKNKTQGELRRAIRESNDEIEKIGLKKLYDDMINEDKNIAKAVSDYENGAIDRDELLKSFDNNEDKMKEAFEKMGYTAPTKENIDKANKRHKDKELLAQIQEETDSMAYKELLGEYNAGKLTTADLEDTLKTLKKFSNDTNDYEYNLYKQAKENPDSINPMTEWSTDWEDLDKRFKDRYEKENQKWLTEKDSNWLKKQGHDTELERKIENFKPSGDIENDERRLEDISSNYFYDEVGIYNENIDSTATKWAHDKAVELNDKNKQKKTEMLVPIDPYKPEDEARKILGLDSKKQKSDLMTAEQLKGKDREEQKEINKQYLKEQNKLAQEKNDANFAKEFIQKMENKAAAQFLDKQRAESSENYEKNLAEREKRDKMGQYAYLLEKQRNRGNSKDEKPNELQNKANKVIEAKIKTPVNQLSGLKDRYYKANSDREKNQIRQYTKSALEAVKEGTTLGLVTKDSTAGWTSMGGWHDENTTVKKYTKIGPNKWDTPYGVKTDEDMILTALYNEQPLRDLQEANDIAGIKSMGDKSSFRYYGNNGPNRVTYKNQSSNDVMNNNIRNAYEEYKKKHPGSKINFSKFKDNYKS